MCTYSMVADHFIKQWPIPQQETAPQINVWPQFPAPYTGPTKEQFQELIDLLKMAKKIDAATNQPNCEIAEKKDILRQVAKHLGIEVQIP